MAQEFIKLSTPKPLAGQAPNALDCPRGCDIRRTQTPDGILRSLKPHYSQRVEINPNLAGAVPAGVAIKTFANAGKHWAEIRGNYRPRRTQTVRVFILPPSLPAQGGGGGSAREPVTQNQWLDALSESAWNDQLTVPEDSKQYKKLKVIVLPAHSKDEILHIKLTGAGPGRQLWSNDPAQKSETTFEKIDIEKPVSLSLQTSSGKSHTVFVNKLHPTLKEQQDSLFRNQKVNAPVFVIDYQVNGDLPIITLSPEPPQMGIFFDGTGNNMSNDNADLNDADAPTNIVKLFELYNISSSELIQKRYYDGVGTEAGKPNTDLDLGFAYTFGENIYEAAV